MAGYKTEFLCTLGYAKVCIYEVHYGLWENGEFEITAEHKHLWHIYTGLPRPKVKYLQIPAGRQEGVWNREKKQ